MSLIFQAGAAGAVQTLPSLALVRLDRDRALLSRRLGRGCRAALSGLAPDATLSLHNADGDGDGAGDPLTLAGPFGELTLRHGGRFLRALSGIDFSGPEDSDSLAWQWQQAALCGRLADTPFDGTHGLVRGAAQAAGVTLRLTVRGGGHAVTTLAVATAACWLRLLEAPAWRNLRGALDRHAGQPLAIALRLARHTLPATAAAALRPGDIVLPTSPAFGVDGRGTLDWGPLRAAVAFSAPATLTILALENRMDLPHTEAGDAAAVPAAASSAEGDGAALAGDSDDTLDALPLTLDFELGRLALNLGQLRCLARGSVIVLDEADPAAIAIVCGRRRLGTGEVVDVDGRLGVRIVEWGGA